MKLEDQVAFLHDLELLELVEQAEEVERDPIEREGLEGAVEHLPRLGFVTRPHEVKPEIAGGADIRGIEGDGLARQRDRFVEAVVARRQLAGDAIHLAERGVDRQHLGDLGLVRRLVVAHVGDGAEQRPGIQMRRVGRQHLPDSLASLGVARVVEIELGQEQLGLGIARIDLERLLGGGCGSRRVLVRQRPRHPEVRRGPLAVLLEHLLERLQRLGGILGLEEQLTPASLDRRVVRADRRTVEGVGVVQLPERLRGARGAVKGLRLGHTSGARRARG